MRANLGAIASLLVLSGAASSQGDDVGKKAKAVMDKHANTIVSIRAVLDVQFMGQNREIRVNSRGTVVHPSGLIMTATTVFSPNVQARGRRIEATSTPTSIKVVFGKEEKEYEAFLAAKDPKLGLAFLKILDLEGRKLSVANLDTTDSPQIGQRFVLINRLDKAFDYTPVFSFHYVVNRVKKPRKAYRCTVNTGAGRVAYTLDGKVLGATITLSATGENGRTLTLGFLAKPRIVQVVVENALEQAQEMEEEEKAKAAEKKKDADKDKDK